ncbi:MAG TPA: outer membrane beta-barrel protein [Ignavibacteria bacterium]|nr:outer membrane beta-barrel protein [Ignavibacteria bacterium]
MKTLKLNILLILLIILFSSPVNSQTGYTTVKKSTYPQLSLSPVGGLMFPVANLSDNFKPGGSVGLDLSYKVNKEVGFFAKFGYDFFRSQTSGVPDGRFFEYSVGPRYYFTAKNLKSSIFLEAGIGAYTFNQQGYVLEETAYPEVSYTKFGYNAGIGAILNLGTDIDLLFKTKYNTIMTEDGSSSFITPVLGIDVRF